MLEAAIIKTIKSTYKDVYLGFLPETANSGVVVSTLSTRTLPQLKRTVIRQREAIINIKISLVLLPKQNISSINFFAY